MSRILPAKHILDFCANAPNTNPPINAIQIGACMLPGPVLLLIKSDEPTKISTKIPTISNGKTAPLVLFVSCALPRLNPFFNAKEPVMIPATNPINATYAFKSPDAIRSTIRSGQPKNNKDPIIIMMPNKNRIIGDEPAVERYSFVTTEIINAPNTIPIISGLAYCTTAA